MLEILEEASTATQQQNWSLVNQCLRQLPLEKNGAKSLPLEETDFEQALNCALDVLEAGDFQERWDVAKVFPKLGERAIAPLIEILEDDEADLEVRWFAARILGEFNHPTVITSLVELLRTAEDEDLMEMAGAALSSFGKSAVNVLADLLVDSQTRLLATQSLSQIRRPEIIEPLLSVVNDSEIAVRATAIEALSSFHDSRIPPILLDALNDRAAIVRKEAVIGLGLRSEVWDKLNVLDRIKPLLYDFNLDVCQQTAIALGRSRTDEAAEVLFKVLQSPATPIPLQLELVRALAWVGTANALDYLQQGLTCVSAEGVHEIVQVLGRLEQPILKEKAAQILLNFFHSNSSVTESVAIKQALAQAWGQLQEIKAIDALLEFLADSEDSVRLHAIAALKNFPTAHQQLQQLASDEHLTPALRKGIAIAITEW